LLGGQFHGRVQRVEAGLPATRAWLVGSTPILLMRVFRVDDSGVGHDRFPFSFCRFLRQSVDMFGQAPCLHGFSSQPCHAFLNLLLSFATVVSRITFCFIFNRFSQPRDTAAQFFDVVAASPRAACIGRNGAGPRYLFANSHGYQ